jgi:polar amino acid transport system substrate-binding protein
MEAGVLSTRTMIIVFSVMIFFLGITIEGFGETISEHKLIVGTKESPPFSMKSSSGEWEGISIELWRQIAGELNIAFDFREMDIKNLLDGVGNGTLDAAVAALTITSEREKLLDFTHPFYTTGLGIAVVSKGGSPWFTVLKRFLSLAFLKVAAALTLLLLVVGFLVWWFEKKKNPQQFGGGPVKGISSGFWWSAVTMTTVGYGDKAPTTIGGRAVALIWMFAAIIIISSFTAAITSSLTVTQLASPVKSPQDLPNVRVGAISNTTSASYLQDNHIIFKHYESTIEGLKAISEDKIDAFVHDAPLLRYLVHRQFQGELDVLPGTFVRQDYGITLTAGSPLREPINRLLLKKIAEQAWQDLLHRYMG